MTSSIIYIIVAVIEINTKTYVISIAKNWEWIPCVVVSWVITPIP